MEPTAAKAGTSPVGTARRKPSPVKAAEGPGTYSGRFTAAESGRFAAAEPGSFAATESRRSATAAKIVGTVNASLRRTKALSIHNRSAIGDVRIVVVDHSAASMPVVSPTAPTPTEAGEKSYAKAQSEIQTGT